ncbi:hypothetical protein M514_24677 [Trichuris suis]|uniref:Uncharacterized protein n=1 Tax=Trichuris suis TaxID=68888 RepID=A0A085N156_9BILA|nr:hypothetical protein M514_24677 [Trichuris suis]
MDVPDRARKRRLDEFIKKRKTFHLGKGEGKGDPSMVNTARCLLQLPEMENLKARDWRILNRRSYKS